MAFRNFAKGIKNFFGPNNRFFNGAREDEAAGSDYYAQPSSASYQDYAPQQSYQQPQNNPYSPPQGYQQPQQQTYQQTQQQAFQQPVYQQPAAQYQPQAGYQQAQPQEFGGFQQQTVNQTYVPPRNRRTAQHAQTRENVVPFPGAAAMPQQPQQQASIPQQPASETEQKKPAACVINVRNISDCRSAIGILRAGDCVIAVIDSIADQSEVRRYVDTLNGACFSLGCTMTRTSSRVGVYFLAPAGMQVLTDQTTTQMNQQSRAPQRPRSGAQPIFQSAYNAGQTAYTARPGYSPYAAPQQPAAAQQPQYTAAPQPVYSQQPQAGYAAQELAQGYSPDQQSADYPQEATM